MDSMCVDTVVFKYLSDGSLNQIIDTAPWGTGSHHLLIWSSTEEKEEHKVKP